MRLDIVLNRAALVALACLIGLIIIFTFKLPHGYWVIWTIMIIYSVFLPGAVYNRIGQRVAGTIAGLLIAFFVVQLVQPHYQLIYGFIALLFFVFIMMITNYAYAVIIISILIVMLEDYLHVPSSAMQIIADRLIGTVIGAAIVFTIELLFYKHLHFHRKMLEQKLQEFCRNYSRHIDSLIGFLKDNNQQYLPYEWMSAVVRTRLEIDNYLKDALLRSKKNEQDYEKKQQLLYDFRNDMAQLSFLVQNYFDKLDMNEKIKEQFINDLYVIRQELTLSEAPINMTQLHAYSIEPQLPEEKEAFKLLQNIYNHAKSIRQLTSA